MDFINSLVCIHLFVSYSFASISQPRPVACRTSNTRQLYVMFQFFVSLSFIGMHEKVYEFFITSDVMMVFGPCGLCILRYNLEKKNYFVKKITIYSYCLWHCEGSSPEPARIEHRFSSFFRYFGRFMRSPYIEHLGVSCNVRFAATCKFMLSTANL